MSDPKSTAEPSIEDILGSIRRIIADDDEQPAVDEPSPVTAVAAEPYDDESEDDAPLELTQKIDEDGTVIDLHEADEDRNDMLHNPVQDTDMIDFQEPASGDLVSNVAADATAAVMAKLARNTAVSRAGNEGVTIEDLIKELLRPMLRDWLDDNLPEMVQTMVERELDRIARRVG